MSMPTTLPTNTAYRSVFFAHAGGGKSYGSVSLGSRLDAEFMMSSYSPAHARLYWIAKLLILGDQRSSRLSSGSATFDSAAE